MTIRLAENFRAVFYAPLYAAQALGLYAQEGVKVELMRAPTGQLVTRIRTEAAAHKLSADVIDISDRVLAQGLVDVFGDYTICP